jgi:hypothetical protein
MPRTLGTLSRGVPRYRKHRASGQAVVTLSGQDFYLGPLGTKTSHREYDRVVAEWLARGRTPQLADVGPIAPISLVEVMAAYKRHAQNYYRRHGCVTNEYTAIRRVMLVAQELYGREPAEKFGPLHLQAVQQAMIRLDWSRKHINKQISRLVRMFRWAASQELVPRSVPTNLATVPGLVKRRSAAHETLRVRPVRDAALQATLPFCPSSSPIWCGSNA